MCIYCTQNVQNTWSLRTHKQKEMNMSSAGSFFTVSHIFISIALTVIGIGSLVHWLRSGGSGGRIIAGLTITMFAWFSYSFMYDVSIYGDRVFEVRDDIARKNAELTIQRAPDDSTLIEKIRSLRSIFSETLPRPHQTEEVSLEDANFPEPTTTWKKTSGYAEPVEVRLSLTTPSTPVTVAGGLCIATWQTDRDTLNYSTEVLPVGSDQWIIFTGGSLRIKKMRWYGEGTMAYQLRKDGSC